MNRRNRLAEMNWLFLGGRLAINESKEPCAVLSKSTLDGSDVNMVYSLGALSLPWASSMVPASSCSASSLLLHSRCLWNGMGILAHCGNNCSLYASCVACAYVSYAHGGRHFRRGGKGVSF